jgi:hypothetical protein
LPFAKARGDISAAIPNGWISVKTSYSTCASKFRPRATLQKFYRQYYLYARGDGKADLWRKRHIIRYSTYLVAAPLIFALGAVVHPLLWALVIPGAAVYLSAPYRRLPAVIQNGPRLSSWERLQVLALIPVIRVVGDIAKMLGYPAGWRWRLQQNPPEWRETSQQHI